MRLEDSNLSGSLSNGKNYDGTAAWQACVYTHGIAGSGGDYCVADRHFVAESGESQGKGQADTVRVEFAGTGADGQHVCDELEGDGAAGCGGDGAEHILFVGDGPESQATDGKQFWRRGF